MAGEEIAFGLVCVTCVVVCAVSVALLLDCLCKTTTEESLPVKCEGFAAPGWYRVADVFKKHVELGLYTGCAFAVYHKGELVVEFVGGYADYDAEVPWGKTTLSCLYGSTKGIGAIVIAILVERGLLDYSAPVAKYWPEFASNGKESITVEQLLSHQAGLIILDENYSVFEITTNPDKMSRLLAAARPRWEPGSDHGFHVVTMGLYMDQLVRRVDPQHRRLDQFFAEEVSRKFGIDCFIGLPKEEYHRCTRVYRLELLSPSAFSENFVLPSRAWVCEREIDTDEKLKKSLENIVETGKVCDDIPTFFAIPCASSHGFATVTAVAKLYSILANGGRHEKQTLLSSPVVKKLNEPLVSGVDAVCCLDSTFGRGTVIMRSKDGHNIFGHPGFGGQAGFADPKHRLGWAYMTNSPTFFSYADDWRYNELIRAMYETVRKLE